MCVFQREAEERNEREGKRAGKRPRCRVLFFGRSRSCLTEEGIYKKNLSMGMALLKASEKNYDRGCEHSLNILIIVSF